MQCDDAAGEHAMAHTAESGGRDHFRKGLRLREAPDRFDEITIRPGIAYDQTAKRRNDVERIKVIKRVDARHVDDREFEADEAASRPQHAKKLAESDVDPRHIADAERNGDGVVSAIRERQTLGIAGGE